MICNKILGKFTKFRGKRTKTLGVANRFIVGGGAQCAPLGFIGLPKINDHGVIMHNKIKNQFRFIDDVLEINDQSRCILSGPPCIVKSY